MTQRHHPPPVAGWAVQLPWLGRPVAPLAVGCGLRDACLVHAGTAVRHCPASLSRGSDRRLGLARMIFKLGDAVPA
jgi:hypothetical protein